MQELLEELEPWIRPICVLFAAALAGACAYVLLAWFWRRFARRRDNELEERQAWPLKRPMRLFLPLLSMQAALPMTGMPFEIEATLQHALGVLLIVTGAWLAMAVMDALTRVIVRRRWAGKPDTLERRRLQTQLAVFSRAARTVIVVVAIGAVLVTFPGVRQVGTSILASAGIAGIVVGIAAQPTLANLIAGLQIAISQPLRLGDLIIFEGDRGKVEEIGITFIVIRLWDDRRVIVPLRWFLENPFENWTRKSSELLGTVALRVDFDAPMDALRDELKRLCESSPAWDGRECKLQVTDSSESTLEIQAVVSAAESGSLGDLRCHIREGMIAFLLREHPSTLPHIRAEVGSHDGAAGEHGLRPVGRARIPNA